MAEKATTGATSFKVKFWGTRGTRMVAGEGYNHFGRNTICVEVECGSRTLVFDAGSGFVDLGADLRKRQIHSIDLFLSHSHYDHVEGIPFFHPFYETDFSCNIWSGRLKGIEFTREIVDGLMKEPYFPIRQEKFHAKLAYRQISDYETLTLGDGIVIETTRLHHPGGATGYRVSYMGRSFAFVTDTTHAPGQRDVDLQRFLKEVDLFAYDCSYTDAEFPRFASFGHSTWEEGCRLREVSGARQMLGIHHMPFRRDEELRAIGERLAKTDGQCGIACDGDEFYL